MPICRRALCALLLPSAMLLADAAAAGESALEGIARRGRVEIIEHEVGTGRPITKHAFAVLHFTAWLYDPDAPDHKGRQFASSRSRGESLSFVYGLKRVLPGLEKGLAGMRVGGRRTLVVPPSLGYDGLKYPRPADVPADAALVFDVELIDVVPQSAPPDE
jgi:FKBP-type peptidyl-prolyl cis-trans isomerase FkpA